MEYLTSAVEWLQNQQIMDQLRGRTTPVVSTTDMARIEPAMAPMDRPAPAAGRSGSISEATRQGARERSAQIDKETEREEREKQAARYRLAGQGIEAAFAPEEPRSPVEGALTQPAGIPQAPQVFPGGGLPSIQALISGKPSVMSQLFGGYG